MTKSMIGIAVLSLLIVGCSKQDDVVVYRTEGAVQEQIREEIQATGTIQPEDLIDVGAQVTGQILAFGVDAKGGEVDYCSEVKEGQLLAEIDSVTYRADLRIAQANLDNAKANLLKTQADLAHKTVVEQHTQRDFARAKRIGVGDALSQADYDGYESVYDQAVRQSEIAEATIAQSHAGIEQQKAAVEKAERNLSYCRIVSPVDGIIIDRRVNIGQTVVSSMSTSSLFLIAKDLSQIQIWVPVNEADIGKIKIGMAVDFTVDAFADMSFSGKVGKVRLNASMTSNVVTYTVEVQTSNVDGLLLPYLSANVSFITETSSADGIVVPAAALRWTPSDFVDDQAEALAPAHGRVFVSNGTGQPQATMVTVGVNNGSFAEVMGLDVGTEVIVGVQTQSEASAKQKGGGSSPFMPKLPSRNPRARGPQRL